MQPQTTPNHMEIYWHDYASQFGETPITEASLTEKASVIGRTGLLLLSCGTGAWRVRNSMNAIASQLGITCTANIGLLSIDYSCFDGKHCFSQSLCLHNTGVNTSKLNRLESFVGSFPEKYAHMSGEKIHSKLDEIEKLHGLYSPVALGVASALACSAFTFLLGGGVIEMICAFIGAGMGNYIRCELNRRRLTLFLGIVLSVSAACLIYTGALKLGEILLSVPTQHEAGYICAMLFIIPGFPFITSGIDLAKLDLRSGLERLSYALIIIVVATLTAWVMALILGLEPVNFPPLSISPVLLFFLRLAASFCGVFGFSVMFNSSAKLAAIAAAIGAVANTLRLELVDIAALQPALAAFIGAMSAGILASMIKGRLGYPRIAITVPSIVIMVPGLYIYRAVYNLGIMSLTASSTWFASAMLIILALPMGLIFARILTDKMFRYCT